MITVYQYLNQQSLTVTSVQQTAISIPQSVVSIELEAVVPTEESASHKGETFVQETEATICDYRGTLELWSTNSYALPEV